MKTFLNSAPIDNQLYLANIRMRVVWFSSDKMLLKPANRYFCSVKCCLAVEGIQLTTSGCTNFEMSKGVDSLQMIREQRFILEYDIYDPAAVCAA